MFSLIKAIELLLLGEVGCAVEIIRLCGLLPTREEGAGEEAASWEVKDTDETKILAIALRAAAEEKIQVDLPEETSVEGRLAALPQDTDEALDTLAKQRLSHLPDWNHDEASLGEVMKVAESEVEHAQKEYADATTGFEAMRVSAALVAACCVAHRLEKREMVNELLKRMVGRIHANCHGTYLPWIREAWPFYLDGGLRDLLGLEKEAVREYGKLVTDTLKERVETGASRPEAMFEGKNNTELLEMISANTLGSERGKEELESWRYEMGWEDASDSILRKGATEEDFEQIEGKLGIEIPTDWKELYRFSNGTDPMMLGAGDGWSFNQFLGELEV